MSPEARALKRILVVICGSLLIGLIVGAGFIVLTTEQMTMILVAVGLYFPVRGLYSIYLADEKAKDAVK